MLCASSVNEVGGSGIPGVQLGTSVRLTRYLHLLKVRVASAEASDQSRDARHGALKRSFLE